MVGKSLCSVCGNEIDSVLTICPFCSEKRTPEYQSDYPEQFKVIDLERGMPIVRDALRRLELELKIATLSGYKAVVLIHGYGSSGKGGAIKEAVHSKLNSYLDQKVVKEVLPGEKCGKRSGPARQLLKRFDFLEKFVQHTNPGLTVVVI